MNLIFFILIILNLAWLFILTWLLYRQRAVPKSFANLNSPGKLEELKKDNSRLEEQIKSVDEQSSLSIQKVGFIRFNPFGEIGGDQSFCISLLDRHKNGFVLTSLHNRGGTRVYAKQIKSGKGSSELSKEELRVVELAK